jgi:hypothetical protein
MPTVARKDIVAAVYNAVLTAANNGELPTTLLAAGQTLFRSVATEHLPKPPAGGSVSKRKAQSVLEPRDGAAGSEKKDKNRFTGLSHNPNIRSIGGLYCVTQQQALVNEAMHYARMEANVRKELLTGAALRDAALANRCVAKLVLMDRFLVADLSPHNPGSKRFLKCVEDQPGMKQLLANTQYSTNVSLWDRMVDSEDCSVARGFGLALANLGYLSGLLAQTVRRSGRSAEERGDNIILFGGCGVPVPGIYIDQVFYFDACGALERFPLTFP